MGLKLKINESIACIHVHIVYDFFYLKKVKRRIDFTGHELDK